MVFNFFKKKKPAPESKPEETEIDGASGAEQPGDSEGVEIADEELPEAPEAVENEPETMISEETAPEPPSADDAPGMKSDSGEVPFNATEPEALPPEVPEPVNVSSEEPEDDLSDPPVAEEDSPPEPSTAAETDDPEKTGGGFFKRLKKGLSRTREILNTDVDKLFTGKTIVDDDLLEDLEELLITSDLGVRTSMEIIERIGGKSSKIKGPEDLKKALKEEITRLIDFSDPAAEKALPKPHVIMVVGVNGVGKTTTIGKVAAKLSAQGKKVLIVAADTFRAAAVEQLVIWAERADTDIVRHRENADPAAVTFDGIEASVARGVDVVLIDTAGRLHNKKNLMEELKKIKRTAGRKLHGAPHETLLVVDATTGQNALTQAEMFNKEIGIDSLALTKLDGTAKGGIVVSITSSLKLPLKYIGVGEQVDDLQEFDPAKFVDALL